MQRSICNTVNVLHAGGSARRWAVSSGAWWQQAITGHVVEYGAHDIKARDMQHSAKSLARVKLLRQLDCIASGTHAHQHLLLHFAGQNEYLEGALGSTVSVCGKY